jgi:short-subunit dehydrogenase
MSNKISVVTGAGSGIGRACALALLEDGWSVALVGRRMSLLEETAELAKHISNRVLPISADIGNYEEVVNLFAVIKKNFGRLDFLFNNAGDNTPTVLIEDIEYKDWNRVLQTNITGSFLCAQQAFRLMKLQSPMGGRIINIGALAAQVPRPDSTAFTVTKHAITGLTKSLSLDGRKYNIACGQIDIGHTVTPTTQPKSLAKQPDGTFLVEPTMDVKSVTATLIMMANLPLDTNFQFITLMPTKVPFIGRG